MGRMVAGGGWAVEVEPERVAGWFDRFAARHGGVAGSSFGPAEVEVTGRGRRHGHVCRPVPADGRCRCLDALVAHLMVPRRIGLLLVRLGGHSVGIAFGGSVVVSRTDRRQVHGRSAAGGWSQQRFARRREGQVRQALQAAAEDALAVLGPQVSSLEGVLLGGDQHALDTLRADRRLAPVFALAAARVLDVPDPRRAVLDDAAARARAVEIVVREG